MMSRGWNPTVGWLVVGHTALRLSLYGASRAGGRVPIILCIRPRGVEGAVIDAQSIQGSALNAANRDHIPEPICDPQIVGDCELTHPCQQGKSGSGGSVVEEHATGRGVFGRGEDRENSVARCLDEKSMTFCSPLLSKGFLFDRLSLWSLCSTGAPQTQQSLLALSGQTM